MGKNPGNRPESAKPTRVPQSKRVPGGKGREDRMWGGNPGKNEGGSCRDLGGALREE